MNDNNAEIKAAAEEKAERSPIRRREIIKTILIIFLAGMLLLTFFSNTIMNRSLAEVATERVTSGKLTERVRGGGVVESNQVYEIKADGVYTVDTINIRKGREVKKDDVLFVLKGGDAGVAALEADLQELEAEYEKSLLELPDDFAEQKKAVRDARLALEQSIAKRDKAYARERENAGAAASLKNDRAEANRLSNEKSKLSSTINAIDSDDYSAAAPELIGDLASLLGKAERAEEAYKSAYAIYTSAVADGADEGVVNAALADASAKEEPADEARSEYEAEKSLVRSDLAGKYSSVETALEEVNARIAEAAEGSGDASLLSYEECVADVKAKQNSLDDAIAALEKARKSSGLDSQKADIDAAAKKKKIDAKKAELEKAKEKAVSLEVKSKYDGVVAEVNVKPDEQTVADLVLASVDIAEAGYTVEAEVSGEKAKKLRTGVKAEVINDWSGGVQAVLSEIKSSKNGGGAKILVFDVTGEAESGSYMELSIPCGSGDYNAIVPKSALSDGSEGKYVLVLKTKNSPFGNRYYAEKVKVDVVAEDETSAAVEGSISAGTYVISAASKSVSPGDQVRMKEK